MMSKKYQTKSGLSARIICTDRCDKDYPIVALVKISEKNEMAKYYTNDLKFYITENSDYDLVEIKDKLQKEVSFIVYSDGAISAYAPETGPCDGNKIAKFKRMITWEDGEGL